MKPLNRVLWALGLVVFSLHVPAAPVQLAPSAAKADKAPGMIRVATVVDRVERDRHEILVYEASRPVGLPWFSELAVVVPVDRRVRLDSLPGSSVGLVPAKESTKEWALYTNVVGVGGDALTLADNVFRLKRVIVCTPQHPVEMRMDGWVYRLKAGQVLLVLG